MHAVSSNGPESSGPLVTVLTPTFNRCQTIHRAYESLCQQTIRHDRFEWLVIDDGSSDGTVDAICRWTKEATFAIRYHWQENSGKHVAYNAGVKMARGSLVLVLDSDDACQPHTIERLVGEWGALSEPSLYFGIGCRCQDQHGNEIGERFAVPEVRSLRDKFEQIRVPEGWAILRADILRAFPFPEFKGEKFCNEDLIWNKLFSIYRLKLINDPLRIYYSESRADGLNQHRIALKARDIKGSSAYYSQLILSSAPVKMRARALAVWAALLVRHLIRWY